MPDISPTLQQWQIAQSLGIYYSPDLSPEQAVQRGLITSSQFTRIKNMLPGGPSAMDYVNTSVISPTLDTVGTPVIGVLTTIRNISATIVVGFVIIGGLLLYSQLPKPRRSSK